MNTADSDAGHEQYPAPPSNTPGAGHTEAAPERTLHMIGATHIDPVWLWPWQEGYQEARATFRSVIDLMEEYSEFTFTCDQVVLLAWVEEQDPGLFQQIRRRVAEGRWVNAGGWWVEPDCNIPMGESLVRQGLYGQRWLQSRFGVAATVGMNADPFGHTATIPMILRGQGMDSYMFLRPGPHESDLEHTLFRWRSPDGSEVLAYRIPHEYCSPAGPVDYHVEKALGVMDRSIGDAMVLYGVGNHGGGPTRANIDSIHRFDAMGSFGRLELSTPRRYFDAVLARDDSYLEQLRVRTGDMQRHAAGCYSAHSGIKAWQQRAQHAVLAAERWAVVAAVRSGLAYPRQDLERAWKHVLFNQFHDILPGTAIEHAYGDARDELGAATAIAKHITARAHNVIARQIRIAFRAGTQPVVVFNPHPWPVSAAVEMHYGYIPGEAHVIDDTDEPVLHQPITVREATTTMGRKSLVFQAHVPALGYATYRIEPGAGAAVPGAEPLSATSTVLENPRLRAEFDPDSGALVSLLDKTTGTDPIAGTSGAPDTQVCADPTDTWGHRVVSYAWPGAAMQLRSMTLIENGPLMARLRVELEWGRSRLAQDFMLTHDADSLVADVTLDWHEERHLLKLRFPVAVTQPRAIHEIPFAELRREIDGAEHPGQAWADLSGDIDGHPAGLTVVMTTKHAWDFSPGEFPSIGVTAVRSPVHAWHDPFVLGEHDRYSHQDQGRQCFRYELIPHGGDHHDTDPARRAAVLGLPLRAMVEAAHGGTMEGRGSFASDGAGPVQVTAIKGTEDPGGGPGGTDVIVRAVEIRGEAGAAHIDLPLVGRTIDADFTPFQLRTFMVPADTAEPIVEVDLLEYPLTAGEDERGGVS